ncbi:hypothetical protein HPB50_018924 [Hyalomma asiaticum]|uniref:Uncharacterized protein n=1 Tax=Hyalomma asiaticum TaxID=266040 RepID=A0ACB7TQ01_HYAAI|nr:hypothetical protein HPB50_018924 [Hyalomma asiaticum]
MDKAAERRARRAAAARARRSDPAVRAREAEASRDSARRRREDPAVRALTLLTSFIEDGTSTRAPSPWRVPNTRRPFKGCPWQTQSDRQWRSSGQSSLDNLAAHPAQAQANQHHDAQATQAETDPSWTTQASPAAKELTGVRDEKYEWRGRASRDDSGSRRPSGDFRYHALFMKKLVGPSFADRGLSLDRTSNENGCHRFRPAREKFRWICRRQRLLRTTCQAGMNERQGSASHHAPSLTDRRSRAR